MIQPQPQTQQLPTFRPYTQQPSINLNQSPFYNSHIYQNAKTQSNDNLYNPLRKTITNPQQIQTHQKSLYTQHAVQSSHLTHEYKHLSSTQYNEIKQHTFMIDEPLKATNHLDRVQGKHFYILDAQQRYGNSINQQQMRNRLGNKQENKYIVYQPQGQNRNANMNSNTNNNANINQRNSQISNKGGKKLVRSQSKYNCYSCLDQPYQRVKKSGCSTFNFDCPANQCIASQKKYSWFS